MNCNWKSSTIADVCKVVTDGAHNSPPSVDDGEYMVSVKDFSEYGFDFTSCRKISRGDYDKLMNAGCVPEIDDVLIGKDGARYFEDVIIYRQKEKPALLSSIAILRADKEKILPGFLYYTMKIPSFKKNVRDNFGSGSAIPRIVLKDFKRMEICYPSVVEQEIIVQFLEVLDGKIRINRRINETLVQQAKAAFDNFYKNAEMEVLFTSIIDVLGGGTPKTSNREFWNGNIPFFTPKDVGNPYTFQTEKYITESGLEQCNSRLYPMNTSFVTARGTVGKVSLAGKPMAMNQSCYALMSKVLDPILVYFYTLKAIDSLKHKASGAVFDAIVTRDFESEVISLISEEDSEKLLAIIKPMMEAIHSNAEEIQRLSSLRDILLPRLMSGEIDVSNVAI